MSTLLELLHSGLAAYNENRLDEAERHFRQVLRRDTRNADARHLLGLVLLRKGLPEEAVRSLQEAVAAKPKEPSFRSNLAVALKAAGRRDEALAGLRETIRVTPTYVQAYLNLGNTLREGGDLDGALDAYRQALKQAPNSPQILNNLGNMQREAGDLEGAVAAYKKALEAAPTYVDAMLNLGSAALATGAVELAMEMAKKAVDFDPSNAVAFNLLGAAHAADHNLDEAEQAYRRAGAMSPESLDTLYETAQIIDARGHLPAAIAAFENIVRLHPREMRAQSQLVFLANYASFADALEIKRRATSVSALLSREGAWTTWPRDLDLERRLRVGLVSSDLCGHVVAHFLHDLLHRIDRSRIELFAYSSTKIRDEQTKRFRARLPHWRDVEKLGDRELAQCVADDKIDILVDMGGHTNGNRLGVFALKPAPIQATWLAYSGTTGLEEIDYIIGDRIVTLEGSEGQFTESPWRLPDSFLCYQPWYPPQDIGELPASKAHVVTFGSFNNLSKLSDDAVALWARVLHAVPRSRLLLKATPLAETPVASTTRQRFAAEGIAPERLTLVGYIRDPLEHMRLYDTVDIALDPFPYNGTTTTAEALWMGVPVLTLRGDRFIARVGESMVTSAGLPDWIAADAADYVTKAAGFASDLKRLATLRAQLRQQMLASPLCDAPRFARTLEHAFRGMWHTWCARQDGTPVGDAERSAVVPTGSS